MYSASAFDVKTWLADGPVIVAMYANEDFQYYSDGVFSSCPWSTTELNHAVMIYGYDSSGNWLVKNSWGTSWGNDGFAVLSGTNDCGVTQYVYRYNGNGSSNMLSICLCLLLLLVY